ncbi:hypothetical protein FHT72_006794 [Rhizobium sp. BK077]|uniref:hypothetical protein n=1 Tax=unclassified Rhizobium TaxID=2613769 RepID=UPI00161429B8|nr:MULTISPECIES: hypothetical protein [unclassified Rhizobium]MBB3302876.1 hypothetical protein [Rhizobium sp. BK112]MBB3372259.1 hypothetical protein [Rhizobium sp. BK077]MBB4182736.1 hypothetical protein [Rhizobium sp. BK109]
MQHLKGLSTVLVAITLLSTPGQFLGGQSADACDDTARYGLIFNLAFHTADIDDKCHVLSVSERRKIDETIDDLTSSNKLGVLKQPLLRGRSLYKASCADKDWVRDWRNYAKTGYLREK